MRLKKNNHGGKRINAGRKKGEPTKTMRVPVSKIEEVKKIVDQGRDQLQPTKL